jgi:mannose-6-phosphate isomerase-like protein (cupin superfamily)
MYKVLVGRAVQAIALVALCASPGSAQAPSGRAAPTETWWAAKSKGGIYHPPMRPLWRLSDLKKMHAGQASWQEVVIKDPDQEAIYHSSAPGTKIAALMHPDTATVFVVVAGEIHFTVEDQQPVTATRGSIVNIMKSTLYSYEIGGAQNALWVEIDPVTYKTVYPSSAPAPPAATGQQTVKLAFKHTPDAYTPPNRLHYNVFDDGQAHCAPSGVLVVHDDHIVAQPGVGYVNPADNKCGTGQMNIGSGPDKSGARPFDVHSPFGHLHLAEAEWWIVQSGGIGGRFENTGEFHATEGDVLYVPPMSWHLMGSEGTSGVSIRLSLLAYDPINMFNTEGR